MRTYVTSAVTTHAIVHPARCAQTLWKLIISLAVADGAPGTQALEEQVEAELQAERAAAEAEADRVKAAIEEKQREREQVEAALRTAVRLTPVQGLPSRILVLTDRTCLAIARYLLYAATVHSSWLAGYGRCRVAIA